MLTQVAIGDNPSDKTVSGNSNELRRQGQYIKSAVNRYGERILEYHTVTDSARDSMEDDLCSLQSGSCWENSLWLTSQT